MIGEGTTPDCNHWQSHAVIHANPLKNAKRAKQVPIRIVLIVYNQSNVACGMMRGIRNSIMSWLLAEYTPLATIPVKHGKQQQQKPQLQWRQKTRIATHNNHDILLRSGCILYSNSFVTILLCPTALGSATQNSLDQTKPVAKQPSRQAAKEVGHLQRRPEHPGGGIGNEAIWSMTLWWHEVSRESQFFRGSQVLIVCDVFCFCDVFCWIVCDVFVKQMLGWVLRWVDFGPD